MVLPIRNLSSGFVAFLLPVPPGRIERCPRVRPGPGTVTVLDSQLSAQDKFWGRRENSHPPGHSLYSVARTKPEIEKLAEWLESLGPSDRAHIRAQLARIIRPEIGKKGRETPVSATPSVDVNVPASSEVSKGPHVTKGRNGAERDTD